MTPRQARRSELYVDPVISEALHHQGMSLGSVSQLGQREAGWVCLWDSIGFRQNSKPGQGDELEIRRKLRGTEPGFPAGVPC